MFSRDKTNFSDFPWLQKEFLSFPDFEVSMTYRDPVFVKTVWVKKYVAKEKLMWLKILAPV